VIISVDTSKAEVMRAASAAGAGLINDVRALREPGALAAAVASGCAVCLVHMQGEPRTMQVAPSYADVVAEVRAFLAARVASSLAAGLAAEAPGGRSGIRLWQTLEHNLTLLRRWVSWRRTVCRWLVGCRGNRCWAHSLVVRPGARVRQRGARGDAALAGARIVRAHDVSATVEALKVAVAVQGAASRVAVSARPWMGGGTGSRDGYL